MTSSAVQPPGSGSELLQTTPSRPTAVTRESDTGTTSPEHTSSGGYTEMLQTEGTDSQGRDENGEHEEADGDIEYGDQEEYEDEEDRLIAQGGIGIPVDEVSPALWTDSDQFSKNLQNSMVDLLLSYPRYQKSILGGNVWSWIWTRHCCIPVSK